jgi:hypothetical protein
MTEQDELNTLPIEELRCGIALQLKTIEQLRIERDELRTRVQELEESLNDELLLRMEALVRVKELEAAAKLALDAQEQEPIFWWDGDTSSVQDSIDFKQSDTYKIPLFTAPQQPAGELTDDEILEIGHRKAWRYAHSKDVHHSSTYTFNKTCLLTFSRAVLAEQKGKV